MNPSACSSTPMPPFCSSLPRRRQVRLAVFFIFILGFMFFGILFWRQLDQLFSLLTERQEDKAVQLKQGELDFLTQRTVFKPQGLIHIATRSKSFMSPFQVKVIKAWHNLNPTFQVVLYDDGEIEQLFVEEFPEFLNLFKSLLDPVERVDIWRYLIVYARGGVYSDSDWMPHKPINEWVKEMLHPPGVRGVLAKAKQQHWLPSILPFSSSLQHSELPTPKVILGFEDFQSSMGSLQVLQWGFYALEPRHPIFYNTLIHIQHMFVNEALTSTWQGDAVQRTGPEPFTWTVLSYLQQQGVNLSKLNRHTPFYLENDVLIASVMFFERRGMLAQHGFKGTWKVVPEGQQWWNAHDEWMKESQDKFIKFRDGYWNGEIGPL